MGQVSHGGCRYPTPHLPTTQPPWLIVFVANSSWMLAKSSCWFWFQCCWWLCQVFLSGFFFFLFFVFCFSPRSCVFLCFFSFLFLLFFCTCRRLDSGLWWLVVAPIAPIWAGIQVLWAAHRCLRLRWMKLALPRCLRLDCMIAQVIGERGFDW